MAEAALNIIVDPSVQPRFNLNDEAVFNYAELMKQGVKFPPIDVFEVEGVGMVLAAGFHRYAAAQKAGVTLDYHLHQGTIRDAREFAIKSNVQHGVRYTSADKRRIVKMYLTDEEWTKLSDREIARRTGVSNTFVSNLREEMGLDPEADDKAPEFADPDKDAPEQPEKPAEQPPAEKPAEAQPRADVIDKEMQVVPVDLEPVFTEGSKFFREAIENLRQTKSVLVDAAESGKFGKFLRPGDVQVALNNAIEALKFAAPHAVCPSCGGKKCDDCRQQGWVPSTLFKAINAR